MDTLFNRHSVRQYDGRPVENEKIDKLLKAGMAAPTAGNQREWEFIVVTDNNLKAEVAACSPYSGCAKDAGVQIVVCGDTNRLRFPDCMHADLGAVCENILLEAVHLDLDGVWLAFAPYEERMRPLIDLFNLPENIVPFAVLSIGYAKTKKREDGRDYDMSRVHTNAF
ncbi:MAG: nitroreductase family protein [Eubacteriaceae bacterium]|nr:nitroreductase family protein [Eubacteriaceae bacterium]